MNNPLEKAVSTFLKKYGHADQRLLLGLSGGPDSLALFHLLVQFSVKFAAAHINHNWRPESGLEAQELEKIAAKYGVPFHLKTIFPNQLTGNLEAACRTERLNFFRELCQREKYDAVLLAHHADDQAETVLKRIFEGTNLVHLSSLQEVSEVEGVALWRPFLNLSKSDILKWLEERGMTPFLDKTNLDPRFLRGKMRTQLIPDLSSTFGKEISTSLCRLATDAQELKEFIGGQLEPYLKLIQKGPMGSMLDLSAMQPETHYLLKALIKEWCLQEGFTLSRSLADTACMLLQQNKANRQIAIAGKVIYIDRGRLFLVCGDCALPLQKLEEGHFTYGPWSIHAKMIDAPISLSHVGWKAAWNGKMESLVPIGDYHLGPAHMNQPYPGKTSISKWWNDHKIPAFLRHQIPVLWEKDKIQQEFLTHRLKPHSQKHTSWLHLTFIK